MKPLDINSLRRAFPNRQIEFYTTVDSTMRVAEQLPPGAVVLADEQTAGQGRHGHAWHSTPGDGIYCSMVMETAPVLTLALGLAAVEAIASSTGIVCDLRWPNDLMLGSRKTAGILVQAVGSKAIAGIGINVNQAGFPPELAQEATSLRLYAGREFSREDIVRALLPAAERFAALDKDKVLRLFEGASSYTSGRRVTVQGLEGNIEGTTAGLDPDGFLVVRQDNGTDALVVAGGVRASRA